MDASLPASAAAGVTTRIGTLFLRRAGPADIGRFDELRRTLSGVELWRAFLASVSARASDNGAARPATVPAGELSLLSDDDLERTAERYLGEAMAAADGPAPSELRRDGERSAEYAVRVLEAQLASPGTEPTTIDRLIPYCSAPCADVRGDAGAVDTKREDPPLRRDEAMRLVADMRDHDDAVAAAQKRVEEIQDLLGWREQAWDESQPGAAAVEPPGSGVVPPAASARPEPASSSASAPAQVVVAEHERALSALGEAARANASTVEELRSIAEALTGTIAEVDRARRSSDALVRRGGVAAIAVLVVSCALSALALLQEQRQGAAMRAWQASVQAGIAAQQQDLQKELARLREERASLAARIGQLESDRAARDADAARAAEAGKRVEAAGASERVRTAPAAKSARSKPVRATRSARTQTR